jgi:hypothetical protein
VQRNQLHPAPRLPFASTVKHHQRLAARGPSSAWPTAQTARPAAQTALPSAALPMDAS